MIVLKTIEYELSRSDKNIFNTFSLDTEKRQPVSFQNFFFPQQSRGDKLWFGQVDVETKKFTIYRKADQNKARISSIAIRGIEIDEIYQRKLVLKLGVPTGEVAGLFLTILLLILALVDYDFSLPFLIFFSTLLGVHVFRLWRDLQKTENTLERYMEMF